MALVGIAQALPALIDKLPAAVAAGIAAILIAELNAGADCPDIALVTQPGFPVVTPGALVLVSQPLTDGTAADVTTQRGDILPEPEVMPPAMTLDQLEQSVSTYSKVMRESGDPAIVGYLKPIIDNLRRQVRDLKREELYRV